MSEPLDVRLAPAAAVAWGAAALGTRGAATAGLTVVVPAVVLVVALLVGARVWRPEPRPARGPVAHGRHRRAPRGRPLSGRLARARTARPARPARAPALGPAAGVALVALAAAALVLVSSAVQVAARDGGVAHRAAVQQAVVRVVLVVAEPPRTVRGAWGPGEVRATTRLEEITWRGTTWRAGGEVQLVGSPAVLLAAGVDLHGAGQRLVLVGRLAPGTGREVGVLRVTRVESVVEPVGVGGLVARIRAGLVRACAGLPPDARGLVPGTAVGDTSGLEPDLSDAMRVAGLTHLVAVSGQHVAIVLLLVLGAAGAARLPRPARAGAAALALAGFVALVGPAPSVLRAAVMGAVAVVGIGVGRASRPVPALCLAVTALLAHDPWAAGSLGFQLSVASTAAIVLVAGPAQRAACARLGARRPDRWAAGSARARLLGALLVPLAAQSAAAPLLVLVRPSVSLWAVLANVLAAPAVLPLTVLGLATALLGGWPVVAAGTAHVAAVPAWWIGAVARAVAALPGASLPWRPGLAGAVGLGALALAAWWAARLALLPPSATRAEAGVRHRPGDARGAA